MFLPLLLNAIFASTFILGSKAVSLVPPFFYVGIRMIIAGCMLLSYVFFISKEKIRILKKEIPWFLGIIFFHIYCAYILEYVCYEYLPASYVSLAYNLSPFITAFFAYFSFRETISKKQVLGIFIGVLSIIPLVLHESTSDLVSGVQGSIFAQIILLLSVVATCGGWIFFKKVTVDFGHSCLLANGIGMFFGGILSYCSSLVLEQQPLLKTVLSPYFLMLLSISILIGNVIVYNMYGKLLKTYSNTMMSLSACTIPFFASFFDWLWFNNPIGWLFLFTACATSFGIYIFYADELKREGIKNKSF